MEETKPAASASVLEKFSTPIALLIVGVMIAGAIIYGLQGAPKAAPTGAQGQGAPVAVNIKDVKVSGEPFIGQANAPATMAVWFDYQCPFCKRFEQETMPKIYDTYVKTGKLKVVFKDFSFLGPDSDTAALFARAVWEAYPDKFYDWYKAMADNQDEEHGGFGDLASIQTMTKSLGGFDVDRITKLMTDNKAKYQAAITADRAEGASMGVNGTPSAIVGTTLFSGAQTFEQVSPLIDAQLKK